MPSWVGRLPTKLGYSSGGSLTADEYKALVLAFLPIAVSYYYTFSHLFLI